MSDDVNNEEIVLEEIADDAVEGDTNIAPGTDAGELATIEEAGDTGATSQTGAPRGAVFQVPIEVVVSVGRACPTLGELAAFTRDTLITLDSRIDDPVELLVNGRTIAKGALEEGEDEHQLCLRITQIVAAQ